MIPALALAVALTAPVSASDGAWARHHDPDRGYDRSITYLCSNGNIYGLREGHSTREDCGTITSVHVRGGEVLVYLDDSGDWHVDVNNKGKPGGWFGIPRYFSRWAVKVT